LFPVELQLQDRVSARTSLLHRFSRAPARSGVVVEQRIASDGELAALEGFEMPTAVAGGAQRLRSESNPPLPWSSASSL
jgi:hypothetical protein